MFLLLILLLFFLDLPGPGPGVHPREEHPGPPQVHHHRQGVRAGGRVLQAGQAAPGRVQREGRGPGDHLRLRGGQEVQVLDQV